MWKEKEEEHVCSNPRERNGQFGIFRDCVSYFSAAMVEHHDSRSLKEEKVDFGSWFQRGKCQ